MMTMNCDYDWIVLLFRSKAGGSGGSKDVWRPRQTEQSHRRDSGDRGPAGYYRSHKLRLQEEDALLQPRSHRTVTTTKNGAFHEFIQLRRNIYYIRYKITLYTYISYIGLPGKVVR